MATQVSSVKTDSTSFSSLTKQGEKEQPKKDLFDRVADRATQAEGAWDFFRIFCNTTQYPQLFSSLKEPHRTNLKKVTTAADLAGSALAFPAMFKNANDFRRHYQGLKAAQALPDTDPSKVKKVRQALGDTGIDAVNFFNNASLGSLFLNDAKVVSLGKGYPAASGIYNATSLISDGAEGVKEAIKLKGHIQDVKKATSSEAKERIYQKIRLSACVITKDVVSIALAVIALLALAFAAAFQGLVFLPILILGLSSVWLITKIVSYFYEQMIQDQPPLQERLNKV